MRCLLFLLFTIVNLSIFSQTNSIEDKPLYKRVGIAISDQSTIKALNHIGVDLTCGAIQSHDSLFIEVDEVSLRAMKFRGINYTVIIKDLESYYSNQADDNLPIARLELEELKQQIFQPEGHSQKNLGQHNQCDEIDWMVPQNFHLNPNNSPNSFGGCLTYDQILQELDEMRALFPNLISLKLDASPTGQTTIEGRTMYYIRISDNPDIDEPSEPETLYQSLIHSREAGSVMQLLYYMWYLLENYDTDNYIKNLLNNQALYFVPVFNPDGFVYNETQSPNGGGMQRKNRNMIGTCSTFLNGVDLNRNSAYYWGNGGSSAIVCNQTHMGTSPFSENETQIMQDFFLTHDFKLALNHHSYKNAMLHGYAGTDIINPRPDEYSKYSHDMSYFNRYAYGPSTSISSLNSGNMNDWMLGGPAGTSLNGTPTGTGSGKHTLAWTPENGNVSEGGFWPLPSNYIKIAKRAMRMNLLAAYYSGKYAKVHDLNLIGLHGLTGSLDFAIENLGQTSSDFTVSISPISLNIVSLGPPITESGMQVLDQRIVNFNYTLNSTIQVNDTIKFKVSIANDYGSDSLLFESIIYKIYEPDNIYQDNPDLDDITNWTAFNGIWSLTTDAFSGSSAITSTISAPYINQESKILELNSSFDLTGFDNVSIQYYAKWDLERSFDYVQFEASEDGFNWIPLCGKLTKPGALDNNNTYFSKGSNNFFQPDGEPLYDGDTGDKWNLEHIHINSNNNSFLLNADHVQFRFNFNTDLSNLQGAYYNSDFKGFTFDDFTIVNASEIISNVGVKEVNIENFVMYPNPFNDQLLVQVRNGLDITQVSIFHTNGKLVYQAFNINKNQLLINTIEWKSGFYFVIINENEVYKVAKL